MPQYEYLKPLLKIVQNIFTSKSFRIQRAFFLVSSLFLYANLLIGVPMISPKVIVECPDLFAKKHFRKENPFRKGGITQFRGGVSFQNRELVPQANYV